MPAIAERTSNGAWCHREDWERRPLSADQRAAIPPDARYGLCVVGDSLDAVFSAMSDDTDGRRLRGHRNSALRQTLQMLPSGRTWYVVSVVDRGDEGPDARARAVSGLRHVAAAINAMNPSIAGWRIVVQGPAALASHVTRAVSATARALRQRLACDVRVVDYDAIPQDQDRFLVELVRGTEDVVAVRDDERFAPPVRAASARSVAACAARS